MSAWGKCRCWKGSGNYFGLCCNPERFGIVEFDKDGHVLSVAENPAKPKRNYCITGWYFYPKKVVKKAREVKTSAGGELEITTLNDMYLLEGRSNIQLLSRGFAWFDTGTMDSLCEAYEFVKMEQKR